MLPAYQMCYAVRAPLQQAFLSGLAKLAMCPISLGCSLLPQLLNMCGNDFAAVLDVVTGPPCGHRVTPSRAPDGLVDSIRFLLSDSSQVSRRLLRLLTCHVKPQTVI